MSELNYRSPLYIQLREVIRSKIEDGEYQPGTAIPSENQLAEAYGLNRLSVRSAVEALENEGLLKSVQGEGVFVQGSKTQRDLETLGGYRHTMQERGRDASTKVLIKAVRPAGPLYARLLQISPEDPVWFIRRIDSSEGEPVALEEIYIPHALCPGLEDIDIGLFSLYDALQWSGIHLSVGQQTLRITRLEPAMARLIDLSPQQAVMEFSYSVQDTLGRTVEFSRSYIRGDKTEFYVHYSNSQLV